MATYARAESQLYKAIGGAPVYPPALEDAGESRRSPEAAACGPQCRSFGRKSCIQSLAEHGTAGHDRS